MYSRSWMESRQVGGHFTGMARGKWKTSASPARVKQGNRPKNRKQRASKAYVRTNVVNPWLSQVNQKLFFARLLIEQFDAENDRYGHLELVLCQSAVYQLECGYRHHLREVADTYKCKTAETVHSVQDLSGALEAMGKHPAEAQEMMNLEHDESSWLSSLLAVWRSFQRLPEPTLPEISEGAIPVRQLTPSQQVLAQLTIAQVQEWHRSLTELVERHRELMVEC